jgi:hypothetical protein
VITLSYGDLLSPYPLNIVGFGNIRKPTLRDIFGKDCGYQTYQSYIYYYVLSPKEFFDAAYGDGKYNSLTNDQKNSLNIFDLQTQDNYRDGFLQSISFFIDGEIKWDEKRKCFLVNPDFSNEKLLCDGVICKENFDAFSNLISQISNISARDSEIPVFKNERARKIWEAAQHGKKAREKNSSKDKTFSIPNVISKLSIYSNSYNLTNIWRLTVFQLYNQFSEIIAKSQNEIGSMNYSVWGGKFDSASWYKADTKKEK